MKGFQLHDPEYIECSESKISVASSIMQVFTDFRQYIHNQNVYLVKSEEFLVRFWMCKDGHVIFWCVRQSQGRRSQYGSMKLTFLKNSVKEPIL